MDTPAASAHGIEHVSEQIRHSVPGRALRQSGLLD
jgi:hypothetical protein